MLFLFYLARFLGSPYHNISGYIAANAPVAAALGQTKQNCKTASACTRSGKEYLLEEEIDSTGLDDVVLYLDTHLLKSGTKVEGSNSKYTSTLSDSR